MRRVGLASIGAIALLATGCPGRPCPVRPYSHASPALDAYRDSRLPVRVLRAEARVDRRDSESRVRGTVMMFIERPDRVRFDVMTQFGPAAVLTSDGETFALMDLRDNRFLEGPTCPENLERLLGLHFSGVEVTRLLLGETPLIDGEGTAETQQTLQCNGGVYRIVRTATDGRRQELDLEIRESDLGNPPELQRMRLRRSEVFAPDGASEWRVTYDNYRFVADPRDTQHPQRGVVMPFTLRFEEPARGIDTMVRFERIELNVEVPAGVFQQEPRAGLAVTPVLCE
jgi:hypothetical protein